MKTIYILFTFIILTAGNSFGQTPLQNILKTYFRTHPLDIRFSSFITSLQEDPWFTTESFDRRTDTTFFYLSGTYINFNPFRYKAKEVRFIIAEDQYTHSDSLKTLDTIIYIQLMGITDTMPLNLPLVKKEYTSFQKKYSSGFWKETYNKNEKDNKLIWEMTNYFIYPYSISPITVAWGHNQETSEYIFTITIRCKLKQNMVEFIVPPDGL